jgi:hypothetical protein
MSACLARFSGMKLLPLIGDRKWTRLVNPPRRVLMGVMVTAMCTVSLASAAAVNADIPCKQWRLDGYTQLDLADGGKVTFVHRGPWMNPREDTVAFPPNGGSAAFGGNINLGIQGNYVGLEYYTDSGRFFFFQGGVSDDGFAYGTAWGDSNRIPTSWRIPEPLRCADNGG